MNDLESLCSKLNKSLKRRQIDIICITGDTFDCRVFTPEYFETYTQIASSFFHMLISTFNEQDCNSLNSEDILFIFGNHELIRANICCEEPSFKYYKRFLESFYREPGIPDFYNSKFWSFVKIYEKQYRPIAIVGLNSVSYAYNDNTGDIDYFSALGDSQLDEVEKALDKNLKDRDHTLVALLHHHFYSLEERNKAQSDVSDVR